jgi:hypothetical protein
MCLKLEHFWLCDDCSQCFDFRIFADRPAVAIRRERYSQRFVRTEEAAFLSRGQQLKESDGSSTVMTQLWGWESDQLLSWPRTAVPQENVEDYLLSKQATSEHSDALPNIRT